ncbi:hypothetical protein [Massilia sp. H6]|uniref:hypothetical protein n=1 Tax=Massilia sp. H6 TaxID=2970464 RepID=UPI002167F385|nr:hypothetical protein [Massilia sp. H6]UVW29946.1 hypothetical protein NRS07_07465 [Massilia sp. H6]
MNFSSLRTVTLISLSTLVSACGDGHQDSTSTSTIQLLVPMQLASKVHSRASLPPAAHGGAVAATLPAGANAPLPDCAADGCSSLRIIDGNAEAYRIDAMRRAAAGDGKGES